MSKTRQCMCYKMCSSKHKITLMGIAIAVFYGTTVMRLENNRISQLLITQ